MQDVSGITSRTYDNAGRVTWLSLPSGSQYNFKYDSVGNKVNETNQSGGAVVTWLYDGKNQAVELITEHGDIVTYSYDGLGRAIVKQQGVSGIASYAYDQAGRLTALQHLNLAGPAFALYTGTYDRAGNLLSQAEIDGSITTFSYDKSYQLVNEIRCGFEPYNITYSYDGVGNRLLQTSSGQLTTYSYNAASELVLTVQPAGQFVTTTYDANGNTLLDAGASLTTATTL
jgi:YD repeat-containing protein